MHFRIRFYVGMEFRGNGEPITDELAAMMRQAARFLADGFGGFTAYDHVGAWSHNGQIVKESGRTYEIIVESTIPAYAERRGKLAALTLRDIFDQNTVLTTIDPIAAEFVGR